MYKDAKEELKRLEDALLEEEAQQEETEAPEEAEDIDALLEQAKDLLQKSTEDTQVFHLPPEVVQDAHVYNTDKMDGDMDSFAEAVHSGEEKGVTGLVATAIALAAGIIGVLIFWIIRYGGAF